MNQTRLGEYKQTLGSERPSIFEGVGGEAIQNDSGHYCLAGSNGTQIKKRDIGVLNLRFWSISIVLDGEKANGSTR